MRSALEGKRNGKVLEFVGCTAAEFREHVSKLMQPGMTLANYGRKGWHLDHIIPVSAWDLTNERHRLACTHYTNIQPLWAHENRAKSDVFDGDLEKAIAAQIERSESLRQSRKR